MRVLVAAPFVGEIGWELMAWQGRVRWLFERGRFDRLVVIGSRGKSAFYEDMPLDYHTIDLSTLPGSACEDRRLDRDTNQPIQPQDIRAALSDTVEEVVQSLKENKWEVETLWPAYANKLWPGDPGHQHFIRFHRQPIKRLPSPWVLLVQRTRSVGADNWSSADWAELSERLNERGINTSVFPCDSESAIQALSACDLAVGQSTGGLHLASLCACPHVVWSVDDSVLWTPMEMTNRQRYQTFWNPLGTPVSYHGLPDQPQPAEVAEWTVRSLEEIGRSTHRNAQRNRFQYKWRIKQWLVRRVIQAESFRRWPWRAQQFVRYKLV